MFTSIQTGFSAGEISPSLYGRVDLAKYKVGTSTCRNFFVSYRGGVSSRAGWAYVGTCKQPGTSDPPRDIKFQFNINQGYDLEFGDQYMRIKSNGAYVVETANAITNISQANPGVFTYTNTNYTLSNGDWIFIQNVGGMTEFNGLTWIVQGVSGANFHVTDLFGNAVGTSAFTSYTSGGTLERIYTVVSPYAAVDLPYLKFTQSADTMSLTCVNQTTLTEYPPYDLERLANTNWVFTQLTFAAMISAPTGIAATAESSTTLSTWYSYVVTAVNSITGEESIASSAANVENNDIAVNAGSNTITFNAVTGAGSYNVYKATPSYSVQVPIGSSYGFVGTSFGGAFTDTNITADFTNVPPVHENPFARGQILQVLITSAGSGLTQAGVGYSITTATGSGFVGTPVIVGGSLVAFLIQNNGENYLPGDTITITGSAATKATGSYSFNVGNPTNNQTIVLNGITWTFKTSGAVGNQTNIQGTLQATINQLVVDLTNSVDGSINVAVYTGGTGVLNITYGTTGVGGNAYTLTVGTYGGTVSGATLTGGSAAGGTGGATATLSVGPQTGTYPSSVAYFQQRRVYASTLNNPDTFWMSQPGSYLNFDSSIPTTDSDAITGAPWAQQINGIQFLVPMPGGLVIFTGNGAWQLNGGTNSAITPSDETATPQAYNGCSPLIAPIPINYDILFVQAKGSIVRDLQYNFFVNVYTGTDQTVLSNHLFQGFTILQWAYAEEPFKIIWAVRDDGILLSLTYLKEQDVYAWARHDTNGIVVSVCSVTEPPVDAVYVIVKRYINGQWKYYSERMDNRLWNTVEEAFCVDSGLTYPMTFLNAILTPAAADGTNNITSTNVVFGGTGYTAPVVTAIDPTGLGTGATFTVNMTAGVITSIVSVTSGQNYAFGTTLNIFDPTGSGAVVYPVITNYVNFTASASVFNSGQVGDVIRVGGGKAEIVTYNSGTSVTANIIAPISQILSNNPNLQPIPQVSGSWSISTPTTIISGLNHLEGETVSILADGSVVLPQVVTNGSITLQSPASQITVGLPFVCQLQTLYLDAASQTTMQGKRKNLYGITVRTEDSRGITVGANQPDAWAQPDNANRLWNDMTAIKARDSIIYPGKPIPLQTGDEYTLITSDWDEKGQIAIQVTDPLPANILALVCWYSEGDQNG